MIYNYKGYAIKLHKGDWYIVSEPVQVARTLRETFEIIDEQIQLAL